MKPASVTGLKSGFVTGQGAAAVPRALLPAMLLGLILLGCSGGGTPPVSDRSRLDDTASRQAARAAGQRLERGQYKVVPGDTLYSIAWRYQRDFRDLAGLNNISAPFEIYPGQLLNVRETASGRKQPVRPKPSSKPPSTLPSKPHPLASTKTKPQTGSSVSSKPVPRAGGPNAQSAQNGKNAKKPAASVPRTGPVALRWPSTGKRVRDFGSRASDSGKRSNNVDFALPPGGAIRVAGAGEIVFARASLAGFRQFVIVKHNDTWLSSYGFNAPLRVREGQKVAAGATLATLGRDASAAPGERVLRFEVRKDGAPVNPASVIR